MMHPDTLDRNQLHQTGTVEVRDRSARRLSRHSVIRARIVKLYARFHTVTLRFVQNSPIPARWFGPVKGLIRDLPEWLRRNPSVPATSEVVEVRGAGTFLLQRPNALPGTKELFGDDCQVHVPRTFVARIPEARILMPSGLIVSSDDRVFSQSCCWNGHFFPSELAFNSLRPVLRPHYLPGTYTQICTRSAANYYHWFSECVPRLCMVSPNTAAPVLMPGPLRKWQEETLELLGFHSDCVKQVEPNCYQVDTLEFPSFPGTVGRIAPWALQHARQRLAGYRTPLPGKRLYISREGAVHRRILNEEEVIGALIAEGFEIVRGHELSIGQQVDLLRDAEVVVGAHGAGLANLLFAPPGAIVIEAIDPMHLVSCYYMTAASLGQSYWYLFAENESVRRGEIIRPGYSDLVIPVDLLLRTLEAASSNTA